MKTGRVLKSAIALSTALATVWCCGAATAQFGGGGGGRGGPPMDPAKAAAAQKLQAEGVGHDLGIKGDAVGKLVAAYQKNRESQRKAMEDLMATGERGPGMMMQMQEINDASRAALQKDLEGILTAEQAKAATATLGTYSRGWDRLVDVLASLGLDTEKQFKGLSLIAKHTVDVEKARNEALQAMDIEGARAASQEHKATLDAAMKDLLTADQLAKWNEGTAPRGRGGPGGPGGGPRGPGGPGEPGAPPPPQN